MSPRNPEFRLGHRPFLDGIRGIAIILVLLFHTRDPILEGGHVGVNIFFVLSGFLITSILVEEWSKHHKIDFRRFYLRRVLRLFPALIALVIALIFVKTAASYAGVSLGNDEETVFWSSAAAIFYFANWIKAYDVFELGALTHTWSLSIEEQFYMIWPVSLFAMLRARWRQITIIAVMAGTALFSVLLRVVTFNPEDFDRAYNGLDTRADALLCGCILAVMMSAGFIPKRRWSRMALSAGALLSIAVLTVAVVTGSETDSWMYYRGGLFLTAIGTAIVMYRYLVIPHGIGHAILSSRVLAGFGLISYGLYIWHMPVYWMVNELALPTVADVPLRISLSLFAAVVSYYVIELPFLRLKDHLPVRRPASRAPQPSASVAD